jgi:hypothetical protein
LIYCLYRRVLVFNNTASIRWSVAMRDNACACGFVTLCNILRDLIEFRRITTLSISIWMNMYIYQYFIYSYNWRVTLVLKNEEWTYIFEMKIHNQLYWWQLYSVKYFAWFNIIPASPYCMSVLSRQYTNEHVDISYIHTTK